MTPGDDTLGLANELAELYPDVDVAPDVLYGIEGHRTFSRIAASIDCLPALIRKRRCGWRQLHCATYGRIAFQAGRPSAIHRATRIQFRYAGSLVAVMDWMSAES